MVQPTPPTLSTGVDNSPATVPGPDPFAELLATIESTAAVRDSAIASVSRLTSAALAAGCDPVRVYSAAGVV